MTFNEGVTIDSSGASRGGGGGRGPMMIGGGLGTIVIVIIALLLGVNPADILGGGGSTSQDTTDTSLAQECTTGADANSKVDCRVVATYDSLNTFWPRQAQQMGLQFNKPQIKLFTNQTDTGCGQATSQVGPFYCPTDQVIYIDTGFYQVLQTQFGSSGGPLAQEYVIAHEYGHHIQNLQGILGAAQQNPQGASSGSVRIELMADCYAGVWAHAAATNKDPDTGLTFLKPLTQRDVDDALSAASSVGDDRIQQETQGRVNPESWTHGSSAERQKWFTTGYQTGDPDQCDTLHASSLN